MDPSVTETYMGEWKNDKRSGYGISERSDGLKYEGEWYANKKYGYGVTTFKNGEKEEGKYKNNVLITSQKKKMFLMRSAKFRERIDAAVNAAERASKMALQKSDIAINRTATARGKGEQADMAASQAREDSDTAESVAKKFAPDFKQPGLERLRARQKLREQQNQNINIDSNILNPNLPNKLPNQIPNQMSNQIPNKQHQIPNQLPNQIPNQIHNQIPNQMSNQIPNQNPNQFSNKPSNPTINQQLYNQNPYLQQQNIQYNDPTSLGSKSNNPYNNPSSHNTYNNPGNPANQPHVEFAPTVTHNSMGSSNSNPNNEYSSMQNKPRNSLTGEEAMGTSSRRFSRRVSGDRPYLGNIGQQSSIDHFDHYKRPPSRDSSVDR